MTYLILICLLDFNFIKTTWNVIASGNEITFKFQDFKNSSQTVEALWCLL